MHSLNVLIQSDGSTKLQEGIARILQQVLVYGIYHVSVLMVSAALTI